MNQLGNALNELDDPPVKALFVYNCNAAAVAPDSERVLAGLRRDDLFTVVHEQFFTDTADYADIVLPATTFLEHKELMGAYGHYIAQISQPAIAPLGEARSNVEMFAELGRRMGFEEQAFRDGEEELIAQALDSSHPWFAGVTKERLERDGMAALTLPKNDRGESLPFSTREWFGTASGRAELLPLPEWRAATESRASRLSAKFSLEFLPRKADNYMNTTFANLPNHQKMESRLAGVLEMHGTDARARGIASGDAVQVWNDRGQMQLTARVSEAVPAGVVASRLDWQKLSHGGANVNELTSQRLTDIGGGATFYSTLVEVRKLDPSPVE
jgi:anaerobic selenocysteine-containing dehydrogenase